MDPDFRKSVGMFMWAVKSWVKSDRGPRCIVDPQYHRARAHNSQRHWKPLPVG